MKTVLHIKNMVCDRCKLSVSQTLNSIGLEVDSIDLGMVGIIHSGALDLALVDKKLRTTGFHLIAQKDEVQIELIKAALIDYVNLDREAELVRSYAHRYHKGRTFLKLTHSCAPRLSASSQLLCTNATRCICWRPPTAAPPSGHPSPPMSTWTSPTGSRWRAPTAAPPGVHFSPPRCTYYCTTGNRGRAPT